MTRTRHRACPARDACASALSYFAGWWHCEHTQVAGLAQLERMRLVAVRTRDALRVHLALHERAPVVDLVAHLAVVPVQPVVEQREPVRVQRRPAVDVVVRQAARAAMAAGAHFDLARALPRRAALGVAGLRHGRPGHAAPLVQRDGEPLVGVERAPVRPFLRPGHVVGARPVARLARHVEFRPGRLVDPGRGVEVLAQVGRMALGAGEVPVLATRCPMQPIAGLDVLPRVEVKPALASLRLSGASPRQWTAPACARPATRPGIAATDARRMRT